MPQLRRCLTWPGLVIFFMKSGSTTANTSCTTCSDFEEDVWCGYDRLDYNRIFVYREFLEPTTPLCIANGRGFFWRHLHSDY
jgi:hypothetical protein